MSQSMLPLVGGEAGVGALCTRFYDKLFADPTIAPLFEHPEHDHAGRLAAWFIELMGGPPRHSQTRGGFPVMASVHFGLKISEAQRQRWISHLDATCRELGWADPVRRQFIDYLDHHSHFVQRESNLLPRQPRG